MSGRKIEHRIKEISNKERVEHRIRSPYFDADCADYADLRKDERIN